MKKTISLGLLAILTLCAAAVHYSSPGTDTYNVKDYGAVGDGSADDTTAFQNALADAEARQGILFVPYGIYKITNTLTITNTVTIRGTHTQQENDQTVNYITFQPASAKTLFETTGISSTADVVIEDLQLVGDGLTNGYANKVVNLVNGPRFTIRRCNMRYWVYGLYIGGTSWSLVDRCIISNSGTTALYFTGANLTTATIRNCYLTGGPTLVDIQGGLWFLFESCIFESTSGAVVQKGINIARDVQNVKLIDCYMEDIPNASQPGYAICAFVDGSPGDDNEAVLHIRGGMYSGANAYDGTDDQVFLYADYAHRIVVSDIDIARYRRCVECTSNTVDGAIYLDNITTIQRGDILDANNPADKVYGLYHTSPRNSVTTPYTRYEYSVNTEWLQYTKEVQDVNIITTDLVSSDPWGTDILNSSGAVITLTLAAGTVVGQTKHVICKVGGNNITYTVSNHVTSDPEDIRISTAKSGFTLRWDGTDWVELWTSGTSYP